MKKTNIITHSIIYVLGVVVYTLGVTWLMASAEEFVGTMQPPLGPLAFLLLFVFSATFVGLLVLGKPAYLYFNGQKSEGIRMLFWTLGFLFLALVLIFVIIAFYNVSV
jgi:membrane protease YdiL (CAAX protease family)